MKLFGGFIAKEFCSGLWVGLIVDVGLQKQTLFKNK